MPRRMGLGSRRRLRGADLRIWERRFRDEFFADPAACASWSNQPRVKVAEQEDGIRITGQLGIRVGMHRSHLRRWHGAAVAARARARRREWWRRMAPIRAARIEETWDPVGLAGTGSHDVRFDDVFVPWHRTFPWPAGIPVSAYPAAVFTPGSWFIPLRRRHSSRPCTPGARRSAQRAARQDRPLHPEPLLEHAGTQRSLEAAEGLWFACRAGMREAVAEVWECALRGKAAPAALRVNARVAAVTATHRGAEIVRTAYDAAGASAVRRTGVLQRLLREASCLTHHISANARLVRADRPGPLRHRSPDLPDIRPGIEYRRAGRIGDE